VTRTKLADAADWLDLGLMDQVRDLARALEPRLGMLEKRYARRLKEEAFAPPRVAFLTRVTPLNAARFLINQRTLKHFFEEVEINGRQLARLNVAPEDVTRALRICDEVVDTAVTDSKFTWAREQLAFCTILALNNAYYEAREAEARAFYELLHIDVQSSNADVLYRRFVEAMAKSCGAAAGHVFVLSEDGRFWQLKASTARAASAETLAVVPVKASVRTALSSIRRVSKADLILDRGWADQFPSIWSFPFAEGGLMQFAFADEVDLLPREVEMLAAVADKCHAAAHKARLLEAIALREEQLSKLAIRMLMVEENERKRISRELHDEAGQSLVVIRLQMEMIEQSLPPGSEERERLGEARDITEKTILDIRRLISDLSPAVLEQLGLGAAVRQLVKRFSTRYPCRVRLDVGNLPQMDTNFQLVIYRLAQECFDNIAQHSRATAVNVSLSATDRVLRLNVEDNGCGFEVEEALQRKDCFGLVGIRERVAVLGGIVAISSTRKEGGKRSPRKKFGTEIGIELPIP
jgi:signal transduction histidine kinase